MSMICIHSKPYCIEGACTHEACGTFSRIVEASSSIRKTLKMSLIRVPKRFAQYQKQLPAFVKTIASFATRATTPRDIVTFLSNKRVGNYTVDTLVNTLNLAFVG